MAAFPELLDARAAVTLRAILLALGSLLLWVGALILAALAVALVSAILWPLNYFVSSITFGAVGSVPGSHTVEQFLTNQLGNAAAGVDNAAGRFWHGLKTLTVQVATEILGLAVLLGYLVWYATVKYPLRLLHTLAHQALHIAHRIEGQIKVAERDAARAYRYSRAQVRRIDKRIHAIDATIDDVLKPEIKTARDIAKDAERLAKRAWDAATGSTFGVTAAAVGAVLLAALSQVGLGWLSCKQNPIASSDTPCNEWQRLADLLGLAVALELALDFDTFVHDCQAATEATADAVRVAVGLPAPPTGG